MTANSDASCAAHNGTHPKTTHDNNGEKTTLNVVVIGCGIGGLLAAIGLRQDGHHVIILDQASSFGEVGAGMRIPPNSFKILHRWGIDLTYMKKTYSNGNRFLRYTDGAVLANIPHGVPEWGFGGSYLMIHRADYHAVLLEKAKDLGVDIRSSSRVDAYDWAAPAAIVNGGTRVEGDVLVVADGVQSAARSAFQGYELPPQDTGDFVYRLLIPGQHVLAEPELRELISQPWVSSWCGPEAHVIGYPVRGGEVYNLAFCCSAKSMQGEGQLVTGENRGVLSSNAELVRRFAHWEPRVRRIVELADEKGLEILKWRLFDLEMVDRWVHPAGRAVILGDAAHPMLPYMASGAAMACEDAATLRAVLKGVRPGKSEEKDSALDAALLRYQEARRHRTAVLQQWGRKLQHAYHLSDGDEQLERDERIRVDDEKNPIFWGHGERRTWLFGHDAEKV